MRRRTHKRALAAFCLAALAIVQATALRGFVLCRAPGEHVAIEDVLASARCHASETGFVEQTGDALSSAPAQCVDTPLGLSIQAADRGQQISVSFTPLFALLSQDNVPPTRPLALYSGDLHGSRVNQRTLSLLRTVILVV